MRFLVLTVVFFASVPGRADDGCPNCQAVPSVTAPAYTPDPPPVVSRAEFDARFAALDARLAALERKLAPAPAAVVVADPYALAYARALRGETVVYGGYELFPHAGTVYRRTVTTTTTAAPVPGVAAGPFTTRATTAPAAAGASTSRSVSFRADVTRTGAARTGPFGGTSGPVRRLLASPFGACGSGG